ATMQETLVTHDGQSGYGTWSADGTRIAFMYNTAISSLTGSPLQPNSPSQIVTVNPDGTNRTTILTASGQPDDIDWPGDMLWSKQGPILFTVVQNVNGCINTRLDSINPDGSNRVVMMN